MIAVLEMCARLEAETEPKRSSERILRVRIDLSGARLLQILGSVREMHSAHRETPLHRKEPREERTHQDPFWPLRSCDPHQSIRVVWAGSTNQPRPSSTQDAIPRLLIRPRSGWNEGNPHMKTLPDSRDDPKESANCADQWPQPDPIRNGKQP